MESQGGEELKNFKKHMRSVRNSDYRAALGLIKMDLGLPPKTSDAEIEALLIYATRDCFGESLDADMVLSAFGLLKGFDNQHNTEEPKDADVLITARRKMFIKKSSYVADRHGPHNKRRKVHYRSYSELEAAGEAAVDAVLSALGSEDGNQINRVAQKIYLRKRQIASYLEESKKYLDIDENECIIGVKLPELIHVNQDTAPLVKGNADGGSQRDDKRCKEKSNLQTETDIAEFTLESVPEAARVIAPAPIEPSDSDSGSPAEQVQEPAPEPPSEPSTSHGKVPAPKSVSGVALDCVSDPSVDSDSDATEPKATPSEKSQLLVGIIRLVILLVVIVGAIVLLFTYTLAEKQGQFEVHTSSCYMRLNFAPSSYDRPPDGEIMFNNEPNGASD